MTEQGRALVMGGAGFIGSHLVDALLPRGSSVMVLDDLSTGKAAQLATHDGDPRFAGVRGSVLDAELVASLVRAHEVVDHLSAVAGVRHIVADALAANGNGLLPRAGSALGVYGRFEAEIVLDVTLLTVAHHRAFVLRWEDVSMSLRLPVFTSTWRSSSSAISGRWCCPAPIARCGATSSSETFS